MERKKDREEKKKSMMRDRVRKRADEREKSGGGKLNLEGKNVSFFIPKSGSMEFDILPYVISVENHSEGISKGDLWYQKTIWVHYGIGSEDKSYICPKTIKKPCPICKHMADLIKEGRDKKDKEVDRLRARERELYNIVDLNDENKGIQLFEYSSYLFGKKLEEEIREGEEDWAGFAELKGGYSIQARFKQESMGKQKFLECSRIDFKKRSDYDESVLDDVFDLDAIVKVLDYDALEKVFYEGEEPDDDDGNEKVEKKSLYKETKKTEEEEEKPAPKKIVRKDKSEEKLILRKSKEEESEEENTKKTKCPSGGEFGKECDKLDGCENCEIWGDCVEEQERVGNEK